MGNVCPSRLLYKEYIEKESRLPEKKVLRGEVMMVMILMAVQLIDCYFEHDMCTRH